MIVEVTSSEYDAILVSACAATYFVLYPIHRRDTSYLYETTY
jgi:hypothetical protein